MEQYWPSELISENARNTTGLVWPLQVRGVCLRLLMVTGGHWRSLEAGGEMTELGRQTQDTPGQSCSLGPLDLTG